jgi:hypothetical protein
MGEGCEKSDQSNRKSISGSGWEDKIRTYDIMEDVASSKAPQLCPSALLSSFLGPLYALLNIYSMRIV